MKIFSVQDALFHADRRTDEKDGQTDGHEEAILCSVEGAASRYNLCK